MPSRVIAREVPVATSCGAVSVTVAYGGAIYATLPAAQPGLSVTCARLMVLADEGRLPGGTVLRHDSNIGSTFTGTVLGTLDVDGRPAVIPQVSGMAYRTGEHVFSIDPHDPLVPGFVLR